MATAVRATDLAKRYRIGRQLAYRTFREAISEAFRAPFRRRHAEEKDTVWALDGVSFEIREGEVVGIVGRNGAGKSTLLKILSRITEPTRGEVELRGRVGALLEVGTGFHPELTGRENVYLSGAVLGIKRAEIRRKFDEIVAFAEVEKFLDTQVKRYSSGMYMRLAFAVAAHLEPEILVVDEVLAVGDAAFQRKCLGRMGDVSREGRTVLFVSHNMTALKNLCGRALWLSEGRIAADGEAGGVVARYLEDHASRKYGVRWDEPSTAPGNEKVRLCSVRIMVEGREVEAPPTVHTPFEIEVAYWNLVPDTELNVSLLVYNIEEVCVFNSISPPARRPVGLVREVCEVPENLLNDSVYRIRLLLVKDTSAPLLDLADVISFEVGEGEREAYHWYGKWVGAVRPALRWRSEVTPSQGTVAPYVALREG